MKPSNILRIALLARVAGKLGLNAEKRFLMEAIERGFDVLAVYAGEIFLRGQLDQFGAA